MECHTTQFNAGLLSLERNGLLIPPECRQAGIWSVKKQQLFLDTLLNEYDSPKIYLRALPKESAHRYELIDGRQRLQCIWDFIDGKLALAKDFVLKIDDPFARKNLPFPAGGDFFGGLSPFWQEQFKSSMLVAVVIRNADRESINEIMSRVNYGAPLYANAETRAV